MICKKNYKKFSRGKKKLGGGGGGGGETPRALLVGMKPCII